MEQFRPVEIAPSPSALIESLRGLGYSPETAIADLIDNSLAAGASLIKIDGQWNGGDPILTILDNGAGMTRSQLQDALRIGGAGPHAERGASDLGRFGLGLKTASLSQCRQMTIVTRRNAETSTLVLDVDFVSKHGWVAMEPETPPSHPAVDELQHRDSGTVVLWRGMDARGGLTGLTKEGFFLRLADVRQHLGMVFHRFLDRPGDTIQLQLNSNPVRGWNPFLADHPASTNLRAERLPYRGTTIEVRPHILPHRDRFSNEAAYEAAGGPGGWGARQGFYVYRGDRMLVPGSWLGLGGSRAWMREEWSRLARISISLPTSLDDDWKIDVMKSTARPPAEMRARLTQIASLCRGRAREVFAWRGGGPSHRGSARPTDRAQVWLPSENNEAVRYRINQNHPIVHAMLAGPAESFNVARAALALIESTVPIERIWLDHSESEGTRTHGPETDQLNALVEGLVDLIRQLPQTGSVSDNLDALLADLPFETETVKSLVLNMLTGEA
jgi:hypothetical protein